MRRSIDNCTFQFIVAGMPGPAQAAKRLKISVLLAVGEAERFEAYCEARGFKKSTLIARLIREHLDRERFQAQGNLFGRERAERGEP
jgi:hypothetical protein